MTKLLSIDAMLEAAYQDKLPEYTLFVQQAEMLATALANRLGAHHGIGSGVAVWSGKDLGGLVVPFWKQKSDQACPTQIHQGDVSGDWGPNPRKPMENSLLHPGDAEKLAEVSVEPMWIETVTSDVLEELIKLDVGNLLDDTETVIVNLDALHEREDMFEGLNKLSDKVRQSIHSAIDIGCTHAKFQC